MATHACPGRGSATPSVLVLLLICALCCCTDSATTWRVGDSQGWIEKFNYSTWTAGKTFAVGDTLFFPYVVGTHDVAEVNQAAYTSCNITNPIGSYSDGNTNITLKTSGDHYYICTYPTHCTNQMKLAVVVGAAGTSSGGNSSSNSTSSARPTVLPQLGCYAAAVGSVLLSGILL